MNETDQSQRDLTYQGKRMSAEPSNVSLENLAANLLAGRAVYVCLEPGDATRYALLLVPFVGIREDDYGNSGLPTWDPGKPHIVVTRLVDMRPGNGAVIWPRCWDGEHRALAMYGGRVNEWTHDLLTWWFAHLWVAMGYGGAE